MNEEQGIKHEEIKERKRKRKTERIKMIMNARSGNMNEETWSKCKETNEFRESDDKSGEMDG